MCPSLLSQASGLYRRKARIAAGIIILALALFILLLFLIPKKHGKVDNIAEKMSTLEKHISTDRPYYKGFKPKQKFVPAWLNSNWSECYRRGDLVALYLLHQDIAERKMLDFGNTTPIWLSHEYKDDWMNTHPMNLTYGNMILQVCYRYFDVVVETEFSDLFDNETNDENTVATYDAVMTFLELYKVLSSLEIKEVAIRNFIATEIFNDYEGKLNFTPVCTEQSLRKIMEQVKKSVFKLKADIDLFFEILENQHYTIHLNKGISLNEIEKDTCHVIKNMESLLSPLGLEFWHGNKRFAMLIEMLKQLRGRIVFFEDNQKYARNAMRTPPAWLAEDKSRLWKGTHFHCLKKMESLVEDSILEYVTELGRMNETFHLPKISFRVGEKDLKKKKIMAQEIVCHSLPICDLLCL